MNQPPVTRLIELITPRLPLYKVVGRDNVWFTGSELMLTGVKEYKGKPLAREEAYRISMRRLYFYDHTHKLRLAWLANGLQGVYDYLAPFMTEESLKKLKNRLMHVS